MSMDASAADALRSAHTKRKPHLWESWRRVNQSISGPHWDSDELAKAYHGWMPTCFGLYLAKFIERERRKPDALDRVLEAP